MNHRFSEGSICNRNFRKICNWSIYKTLEYGFFCSNTACNIGNRIFPNRILRQLFFGKDVSQKRTG